VAVPKKESSQTRAQEGRKEGRKEFSLLPDSCSIICSVMKPFPGYVPDGDEPRQQEMGTAAAMDMDLDGENLEILGDLGLVKPSDDDFFNAFEDDFDDTDLA
jgi:hypothetical protein